MHRIVLALIAATPLLAATAPPALTDLRDTRRVLIVFAPGPAAPETKAQDAALGSDADLAARDLTVVHVEGARVEGLSDRADDLRRTLHVPATDFAVRLIGKDGHVALQSATPVPASRLFGTIDAMPMRKDEMRQRGN